MGAWQLLESALDVGAHDARVGAELGQDARHDAALLIEEREQEMLWTDLGVVLGNRDFARGSDRFLRLHREFVELHDARNVATLTYASTPQTARSRRIPAALAERAGSAESRREQRFDGRPRGGGADLRQVEEAAARELGDRG